MSEAELELRYACIPVLPPVGKQKRYPALDRTILHAREAAELQGRTRINGKLAADLPIASVDEAVEKLRWHAGRWKIELFRKVLKSGCRTEAAPLRTAERPTKLIAVFLIVSVIAWRGSVANLPRSGGMRSGREGRAVSDFKGRHFEGEIVRWYCR